MTPRSRLLRTTARLPQWEYSVRFRATGRRYGNTGLPPFFCSCNISEELTCLSVSSPFSGVDFMGTPDSNPRATTFCGKAKRCFQQPFRVFLALFLLATVLPPASAEAQETSPTYTISECEQVEEELLLSDLNRISQSVLEREKSGLDLDRIVEENWAELDLDSVVDKAVDDVLPNGFEMREALWIGFSPAGQKRRQEILPKQSPIMLSILQSFVTPLTVCPPPLSKI